MIKSDLDYSNFINSDRFITITNKSKKFAMHTLLQVQSQNGAYNYSEYELGMWQGMENMLAKFEDRKPTYQDITKVDFINSYRNR